MHSHVKNILIHHVVFSYSYRTYWKTNPSKELISSENDALHVPILENLASRSMLLICFRHDAFQYLFNNKSINSDDGRYLFLTKEDCVRCMLTQQWDQLLDGLGNGVKVAFPVTTRMFLSLRPKNNTFSGGQIQPLPRYIIEKLSIHCRKQAFIVS